MSRKSVVDKGNRPTLSFTEYQLQDLKRQFPNRIHSPSDSIETIMYNSGMERVIQWIEERVMRGTPV